ncbi:hypothetical protein J6590_050601 [Homalodisca vitripennis]|nr:hypothetical protein J6590_050601 [Homalodisca vitripennis]
MAHDAMDAVVVSGPGSSNSGKGSRPQSRPSPPLDYCRPCTAADQAVQMSENEVDRRAVCHHHWTTVDLVLLM